MRTRFVIVMLLVLALAVPAEMLAQQSSKAEKEIRAWIEEMRQVNLKGGPEAVAFVDKYVADDYIRIPGNGALNSKAELLNGFRSGALKPEVLEYSDIKVNILAPLTLVFIAGRGCWRSETACGKPCSFNTPQSLEQPSNRI
jgi:hypothetical protein